jgi:2-methylaconitate cis-trans-isomerase PrpF
VTYDGDAAIDGVPGTAAPVHLAFLGAAGSKTGKLLPTGSPLDSVEGVQVSCVDAAMPVVIARAADFGKTGYETVNELNADKAFMSRLEKTRIAAGQRMGIHDAADRVIPKPVLIAPPARGGTLAGRYFMPHLCHGAFAITGSVAVATAAVTPGTLPAMLAGPLALPTDLRIEHPSGHLDVRLEKHADYSEPAAFVVRTARRLFEGHVLVKRSALTSRRAPVADRRDTEEEAEEVV